jgi:hypothetical protein
VATDSYDAGWADGQLRIRCRQQGARRDTVILLDSDEATRLHDLIAWRSLVISETGLPLIGGPATVRKSAQ